MYRLNSIDLKAAFLMRRETTLSTAKAGLRSGANSRRDSVPVGLYPGQYRLAQYILDQSESNAPKLEEIELLRPSRQPQMRDRQSDNQRPPADDPHVRGIRNTASDWMYEA
jgi:hypothetical protein